MQCTLNRGVTAALVGVLRGHIDRLPADVTFERCAIRSRKTGS